MSEHEYEENRIEETELESEATMNGKEETPMPADATDHFAEHNTFEAFETSEPSETTSEEGRTSSVHAGTWQGSYYQTSDGRDGYMYTPLHAEEKIASKHSHRKGLKIAAIVMACLLCWGAGMSVSWLVARWIIHDAIGGLEETQSDSAAESNFQQQATGNETAEENGGGSSDNSDNEETHPSKQATIVKVSPQREDTDGDGKMEVETDASGQVLTSAGTTVHSVATVCHMVQDSVVEISTKTVLNYSLQSGAGSGVIIAKEGYIITNNHVIEGSDTISVRLTDGSVYTAQLVGRDEETDIAVIWIDAGDKVLTVATLGASSDLVVGEPILACGNPLGSLGGTMTEGIVSATEREIRVEGQTMKLLQVSAPINPGNSGGGLFNMAGHLVGVVNAKYSAEGVEGLGFAVPIDTACAVAEELIQYGYVRNRPTLGITPVSMSAFNALQYFHSPNAGIYVYRTTNDAFLYGDRLAVVNGKTITAVSDVQAAIAGLSVGDTVEVSLYRNEQLMTISVELQEQQPQSDLE